MTPLAAAADSPFEITFDGRPLSVLPGRTIAAALLAAGIRSWPAPARPATSTGSSTRIERPSEPTPGPDLQRGTSGPGLPPGSPSGRGQGPAAQEESGDDAARAGLFCGIGVCFGCLVTVNGRPGIRACLAEAHPGDVVTTAWGGSA